MGFNSLFKGKRNTLRLAALAGLFDVSTHTALHALISESKKAGFFHEEHLKDLFLEVFAYTDYLLISEVVNKYQLSEDKANLFGGYINAILRHSEDTESPQTRIMIRQILDNENFNDIVARYLRHDPNLSGMENNQFQLFKSSLLIGETSDKRKELVATSFSRICNTMGRNFDEMDMILNGSKWMQVWMIHVNNTKTFIGILHEIMQKHSELELPERK